MRTLIVNSVFVILALAVGATNNARGEVVSYVMETSTTPEVSSSNEVAAQANKFIKVEGPTLSVRFKKGLDLGRPAAAQTTFWISYSFELKPGTGVDINITGPDGSKTYVAVASGKLEPKYQTRNPGIFFKYDSNGSSVSRVELYDLDVDRNFEYPVYWLGRVGDQESLSLLKSLLTSSGNLSASERITDAIGLHKSEEAADVLKELLHNSQPLEVRKKALFWLGRLEGSKDLLLQIAKNGQENVELRMEAMSGIGKSRSTEALAMLESLYKSNTQPELKLQIINDASRNTNHKIAAAFLLKIAEEEPDYNLNLTARSYLARMAGDLSLSAPGATGNVNDEETQFQLQAVSAIMQRPPAEAVSLLIDIAKTSPKPLVRERAIRSMASIRDPRVLEFFKEVLLK